MQKNKSKSFESEGDEYIFLFESLISNNLSTTNPNGEPYKLEELRNEYKKYVDIQSDKLEDKYEKGTIYWNQDQEQAIIDYNNCSDDFERNKIFSRKIYKPLKKLIENIIFNYKLFRNDVEVSELQSDCMSFLMTKIEKYDVAFGRAYSYFGTISKHYLQGDKKKYYEKAKSCLDIDDNKTVDEVSSIPNYVYELDQEDVGEYNLSVFTTIIAEIEEEIKRPKMSLNDKKVGEAIVWMFQNHDILKIYNKILIYHLLKERTGLQTKEITNSLSRYKKFYELFKKNHIKE